MRNEVHLTVNGAEALYLVLPLRVLVGRGTVLEDRPTGHWLRLLTINCNEWVQLTISLATWHVLVIDDQYCVFLGKLD